MKKILIIVSILLVLSLGLNFYFVFNLLNKENVDEFIINYADISYKLTSKIPTIEDSFGKKLYHKISCPLVNKIPSGNIKVVDIKTLEKYNFSPCKNCIK